MNKINFNRVVGGGILAAILLFVMEGFIQGAILGSEWKAWAEAMGSLNHAPSNSTGMLIWLIVSLVHGITGVWIYAAIRPRYGAGPKTALLAGLLIWLPGWLTPALGYFALGNIPHHIAIVGSIGGLLAALISIVAGAYIYKEV